MSLAGRAHLQKMLASIGLVEAGHDFAANLQQDYSANIQLPADSKAIFLRGTSKAFCCKWARQLSLAAQRIPNQL